MPKPFLELVAKNLQTRHPQGFEDVCVVLPSRRASLFLKRTLAALSPEPVISPVIVVIDELTSDLSGLFPADSLTLQFQLYASYVKVYGSEAESFESFIKWSSRLLQDYNEIDRYMVDAKAIFENVTDAKALERWGVEGDTPEMIEAYIRFWKTLHPIYLDFQTELHKGKRAYQGLMYREAAGKVQSEKALEKWCEKKGCSSLYFVGFNALNTAEQVILKSGLESGFAQVWFDADPYYLNDPAQEAGMFMRQYRQWRSFDGVEFPFVEDRLRAEPRKIEIIGVPKQIGMAKTLSGVLSAMKSDLADRDVTDHMALVLADEGLLMPVLNSIPSEFDEVNVTMGLPLRELNLANSVEIILEAHERALRLQKEEGRSFQIYHKDLERLLLQPFYQFHLGEISAYTVLDNMRKYNAPFLGGKKLAEWMPNTSLLNLLKEQSPAEIITALAKALAEYHDNADVLPEDLEAAQHLYRVSLRLLELFEEYSLETDMTTTLHLYRQLLKDESLDFFGEPLNGLQVMGVLETRLLSFDNLIMTSVNEDVLPAGRSENSFIPYDIKRFFGLPTHKEKDAIYAYHFYRLLSGTKRAVLLYNTESDGFNAGEASRFIEQIRHEFVQFSNTEIVERVYSTHVSKDQLAVPFELERGPYLDEAFQKRAEKGIAPSHLKLWVENPVDFYHKVILGQGDVDEVEEVLGDRSMGNVIHKVLEDFYSQFIGARPLDIDYKNTLAKLPELLYATYKEEAGRDLEVEGRNNLVGHAMIQMTRNFLTEERKRAAEYEKSGRDWIIRGVEVDMRHQLEVPGIGYTVLVKGFADRLDTLDGVWQVIDYKTGSAKATELNVEAIEEVANNPDKAKALQLMTYAWLVSKSQLDVQTVTAGIFGMRKNKDGLMVLSVEKTKRSEINSSDLQTFEEVLTSLLYDIFKNEGVIRPNEEELVEES